MSQPYHPEGEGLYPLAQTAEESNEVSNGLSLPRLLLGSEGELGRKGFCPTLRAGYSVTPDVSA